MGSAVDVGADCTRTRRRAGGYGVGSRGRQSPLEVRDGSCAVQDFAECFWGGGEVPVGSWLVVCPLNNFTVPRSWNPTRRSSIGARKPPIPRCRGYERHVKPFRGHTTSVPARK